ncbi:hypothetical protein JRQ81_019961 [Phrynocephalus forsythii]|uniref:Uncharacterized protein n=1 Tax=Phrynocephalus forsythii TaxID=171643 RepID=A0A9Q1AZC0_9SAUR|nr:hypothetical protein JRQ81_019961 [Phrynocephalus forsythii]
MDALKCLGTGVQWESLQWLKFTVDLPPGISIQQRSECHRPPGIPSSQQSQVLSKISQGIMLGFHLLILPPPERLRSLLVPFTQEDNIWCQLWADNHAFLSILSLCKVWQFK